MADRVPLGAFPDPATWFQKTPGGPWYKIGNKGTPAYYLRICNSCGQQALMEKTRKFCGVACAGRRDNPTYGGRHNRVRNARGKASGHACVDCGAAADDWSQAHGTTGLDPEHYQARCKKCHATYDRETRFPRGERNPRSRLSDAQREAIRVSRGVNLMDLAERFGVSVALVKTTRRGIDRAHPTKREGAHGTG